MAESVTKLPGDSTVDRRIRRARNLYAAAKAPKELLHTRWETLYLALNETRKGRLRGLAKPRANEIFPIITALAGWFGDAMPKISIAPANINPESKNYELASQLAADLEIVIESITRASELGLELEKMFYDALTYGTGFLKAAWDPDRLDGLGDAFARWSDCWNMFPDPFATSSHDWSFVVELRKMSREDAIRRYGDKAKDLSGTEWDRTEKPQRPDKAGKGTPPMALSGRIMGVDTQYGADTSTPTFDPPGADLDAVTVAEVWTLNEDYDNPAWELSVISQGKELAHFDVKDELTEYGKAPYVRYVIHEMGEFWGPSLAEFLLTPQDALNDVLFHAHNNARLAGDPMFDEPIQAGTSRIALKNRPGQRVPTQAPGMLKWMDPPPFPPALIQLIQFWVSEMERISGLAGIARGGNPSRRENAEALEQMSDGSFTRTRNGLRNLEHALSKLGEMLCSLVIEHYDEPRVISLIGPEGEPTARQLSSRHFFLPSEREPIPDPETGEIPPADPLPLKAKVWVEAGSSHLATQGARVQEAQMMFTAGIIDREEYLKIRRWPGWRQIVERIAKKEAQGAFGPPAARQRAR